MNQTLRFVIMAAAAYMVFLCVIRIVLGAVYKARSFRINLIGMVTVYGSLIISRFGGQMKLPEYIIYIVPVLLIVLLPTLSLNMKTDQTLKYLVLFPVSIFLLHVLFSLLLGWRDLLPFVRINSLW